MNQQATDLQSDGFRLVLRDGRADWVHPLEMQPADMDCTDMDDEQFEIAVARATTAHQ